MKTLYESILDADIMDKADTKAKEYVELCDACIRYWAWSLVMKDLWAEVCVAKKRNDADRTNDTTALDVWISAIRKFAEEPASRLMYDFNENDLVLTPEQHDKNHLKDREEYLRKAWNEIGGSTFAKTSSGSEYEYEFDKECTMEVVYFANTYIDKHARKLQDAKREIKRLIE